MSAGGKSIEEILKALQGTGVLQSQQSSTTSTQTGAAAYPPPNAQQKFSMPPGMSPYPQATPSYPPSTYPGASYPPPPAYPAAVPAAAGGGVDLSAIKPVSSGTVSIEAAIERAKAIAAEKGVAPYDRSTHPQYASDHRSGHNVDPRGGYGRSRSRSPPARRDSYRDNFSAYRDERREASREYGRGARERSYSPGPHGSRATGTFSPRGGHNANARERSPLRSDDNSEIIEIESSLVGLIIGRQGENLRRVESETGCRVQFLTPPGDTTRFRQCKITGPRARRAEARASINRIIEDSGMGAIARAGGGKGGGGGDRESRDNGSGNDAPSLRENEDSMQIMVPDRTVGLIIGRGGETIRDLQERSGCHINIVGESKSVNGLRPVNLIGPSDSTMKAKNLILEIVDSDTRNANAGREGRSLKQPQHDNSRDMGGHEKVNDSIFVPSEAVGMIIGKGGETIREMQNMTGCKINVSQSSGPGEVEREIGLVGNREAISKAKRAIEDKVETVMQRMKNGPGGGRGGGGRGHQRHDDYDRSQNTYGRSDRNDNSGAGQQQQQPPAQQALAPGAADPYAPYGGYQNYLALWYQAIAGAASQAPADGSKPAGI